MYCIQAGEKCYFGVRDDQSDPATLVLKDMIILDDHPYAVDVTPYTLGAWVDWKISFRIDLSDLCPFEGDGYYQVYLDHKSVDPGAWEPTHHTIEYYQAIHFDHIGLKTNEPTSDEYTLGVVKPGGINLVMLNLTLDGFNGKLEWEADALVGIEILFDSYGLAFWGWTAIPHPKNGVTIDGLSVGDVSGNLSLALSAGFKASAQWMLIDNVELDVDLLGLDLVGTKGGDELWDKEKWHICFAGDCFDESLTRRMGPIRGILDLTGLAPQTIFESPSIDLGELYHFYNSNTYHECKEGECPHWAWYTKVLVQSLEDPTPLPNVDVRYDEAPDYCRAYYSGTTGADGTVDLYMPAGSYEITAKLTSPLNPDWTIEGHTPLQKKDGTTDTVTIPMNIPMSRVSFKNAYSGEPAKWPEDISFSPFYSEDVQIPDTVPELSGRVFTGWNTAADGSGISFAPGTKLTLSDDLTLWAQWQAAGDSWYVIYNANGGTKVPAPQIIPKGRDAVLSSELPEAGKMIFKGWTPDKQKPDTVYQRGDTLKYESGKDYVVLYALWDLSPVPQPIHISFEANGLKDAVLPADIWCEQNRWLQLEYAFAPMGSTCTFLGWSEDPCAENPEYQAGKTYYFYRDTRLFAIWKDLDTVTLTFMDSLPGAAEGIPSPISIVPSMSRDVHIPNQIPQKGGRIFTGWNTASDGSGKNYAPGAVITLAGNTTLWAQWKIAGNDWYIIYNANGGTKAPAAQDIPLGEDAVLTTELPEGGTMIFRGWATEPDASAAQFQPGDTLKYDSGKNYVVLYALWNLDPAGRPVTVSFDVNGGRPDTAPKKITVPKGTWIYLPDLQPSWDAQHDLAGWSTDPKAAAPAWDAGASALFDQDTTLYAIWKAHYKVIEGAGSVWIKGSQKTQRFVADGDRKYFTELRVDGLPFMDGVQISSGSTIADISADAMEKLSVGDHTVTFVYVDGTASAPFTVQPKTPPTGDAGHPALWLVLVVLGTAGLVLAGKRSHHAG